MNNIANELWEKGMGVIDYSLEGSHLWMQCALTLPTTPGASWGGVKGSMRGIINGKGGIVGEKESPTMFAPSFALSMGL